MDHRECSTRSRLIPIVAVVDAVAKTMTAHGSQKKKPGPKKRWRRKRSKGDVAWEKSWKGGNARTAVRVQVPVLLEAKRAVANFPAPDVGPSPTIFVHALVDNASTSAAAAVDVVVPENVSTMGARGRAKRERSKDLN